MRIVSSVNGMIVASVVSIALGVGAALVFRVTTFAGLDGAPATVLRIAAAGGVAIALLALATTAIEQFWLGLCIPFGIALALEHARNDTGEGALVVVPQLAVILVGMPIVMAVSSALIGIE